VCHNITALQFYDFQILLFSVEESEDFSIVNINKYKHASIVNYYAPLNCEKNYILKGTR